MAVYSPPQSNEHAPYYSRYIDMVPAGDVLQFLAVQGHRMQAMLEGLDAERGNYRYAPGKWSLKEVLGHLIDTERLFAYRALSFARDQRAVLPGMEPDEWAAASNAGQRRVGGLRHEYAAVRRSPLALLRSFGPEVIMQRGTASGCEFSVRAIPYIIAGHELHHLGVIEERYL